MYIKQIKLKNIKSFKDVKFDFTRPDGSFAGWTVFVGGNGSGKTTVLRAIALALMGPRAGDIILGRNEGWISKGAEQAHATATISIDREFDSFSIPPIPITNAAGFEAGVKWKLIDVPDSSKKYVEFGPTNASEVSKKGPWFPPTNGWFMAGYGPMRRLTGNSEDGQYLVEGNGREVSFVTLFAESAALGEGENWLRWMHARSLETDRPDRIEMENLVEGVKSLLNDGLLPEGIRISRITVDYVYVVDGNGVEFSLEDASDGFRVVLATVMDIIQKLYVTYGKRFHFLDEQGHTIVHLPGIILIDEAEAHLHPVWQRDLPEWFKKHFPNIQFLVTTHSPLIAQSADPNGLFILPAQSDYHSEPRQASAAEYEKVRLGAAFKTVLGVAFGLDSTRSRWASEQIARWELLDAKRRAGALTREEVGEHELLRGRMRIAFPEISSFADM